MADRPWLPTDLPNLLEWWDASQGVTSAAGSVSQWLGVKSGIAAIQATAASQPTFSASARNGKPGLSFSGSNQNLKFNASLFLIANLTVALSGYMLPGYAGQWRRAFAFGQAADQSSSAIQIIRRGSDNLVAERTLGASGANGAAGVDWAGFDRFPIVTKAGTVGKFFVDGLYKALGTFAATFAGVTSTDGYIGQGVGYADNFPGIIQQICVFSSALSDSDRQKLEGWESWYTGKNGSNLAADHPYKAAAPTVDTGGAVLLPRRRRPILIGG
jgi:hypothetical protein